MFSGLEHIVRENEPLAPLTWFRIGGHAQYFAEPTDVSEVLQLLRIAQQHELPTRVLGAGSRVLIPDEGVQGLVLHLSAPAFTDIEVREKRVMAGGGAKLGHLISTAVREGLGGLEALVGIPGTVAGALRGNAGSHGTSIGQWTDEVTVINRQQEEVTLARQQLRFSYGDSSLDEPVILRAVFQLETGDSTQLTRQMQKLWIVKRAAQPSGDLGTGRIFKDPQGEMAADLIERAGLRNERIGAARVSEANSNFIEVEPGAKSVDVRQLIDQLRKQVAEKLGVELECELQCW